MAPLQKLMDQELIARLGRGDEHAFMEIYNRQWNKLTAIAYT
jgi:hypothetical protein